MAKGIKIETYSIGRATILRASEIAEDASTITMDSYRALARRMSARVDAQRDAIAMDILRGNVVPDFESMKRVGPSRRRISAD